MSMKLLTNRRWKKRVVVRTPGGLSIQARKERAGGARCGICREGLFGQRSRPSRAFGGNLCAGCSRDVLRLSARAQAGELKQGEIDIPYRQYVRSLMGGPVSRKG